ncbi:MAG: hypothetical protein FWD17_01635, partial [Polyangiaceae bacterium]|nr:hypothetical protein [Polyangiaceae bacterium]
MKVRALTFTAFADRLGLKLTNGQRVLARVAFDGVDPVDLEGDDRDLAATMFGDIDHVPPLARRVLCLTLGRASGKTTLASCYGVWRLVTSDVSRCGPGDTPCHVTIAPSKRTAQLAVRMARELVTRSPDLRRRVERETSEGFELRRPDGRLAAFSAFAASRGGASARGLSVLSFVLDEGQFFQSDSEYAVTDRDCFAALVPRLMTGGSALLISTPWVTPTLHGELHEQNFGHPSSALAARASTILMRDNDPAIADLVRLEQERDAVNAAREFFCDTSASAGTGAFFDHVAIERAVDPSLTLPLAPTPGTVVAAAAD